MALPLRVMLLGLFRDREGPTDDKDWEMKIQARTAIACKANKDLPPREQSDVVAIHGDYHAATLHGSLLPSYPIFFVPPSAMQSITVWEPAPGTSGVDAAGNPVSPQMVPTRWRRSGLRTTVMTA